MKKLHSKIVENVFISILKIFLKFKMKFETGAFPITSPNNCGSYWVKILEISRKKMV